LPPPPLPPPPPLFPRFLTNIHRLSDEYPSPLDGYSSSALPILYSAASDPFGADASADVTSSGLVEGPGATKEEEIEKYTPST
jgi:hypothetical protein